DHRRDRRRVPGRAVRIGAGDRDGSEHLRRQRRVRRDAGHRLAGARRRGAHVGLGEAAAGVEAARGFGNRRAGAVNSRPSTRSNPTGEETNMNKTLLAVAIALAGTAGIGAARADDMPTVKIMVGGIDKQIYLPYQLAQNLGFYKKYGVNVELSTEQNGGVGAEEAMASGQVDMAGAWYIHTIDFQSKGKQVEDIVQLSGAPGEREMCANNSGVH